MAPRGRSKAATARSAAASKGWATRKANALRAVRAEAARRGWATRRQAEREAERKREARRQRDRDRREGRKERNRGEGFNPPNPPGRRRWYEEIDEIEQPGKEKGYKSKGKGK